MTDKKYPSELAERFQVRMPPGMRDRIAKAAEENGRSMNAEIVHRLERSFEEQGAKEVFEREKPYVEPLVRQVVDEYLHSALLRAGDNKGSALDELAAFLLLMRGEGRHLSDLAAQLLEEKRDELKDQQERQDDESGAGN